MQDIAMAAAHDKQSYGPEEGENCPECSHTWPLDGSAHFADCRYWCLDDDRDEESSVRLWAPRRKMITGELQKAAA
jgi:hypothetical protein